MIYPPSHIRHKNETMVYIKQYNTPWTKIDRTQGSHEQIGGLVSATDNRSQFTTDNHGRELCMLTSEYGR